MNDQAAESAPGRSPGRSPGQLVARDDSVGHSCCVVAHSCRPARRLEYALASYDWGEVFTALDLVLAPTLDDVLLTQLGEVSRSDGDNLTWLVTSYLFADSRRRARWSRAVADLAVEQRPSNREVLGRWIEQWSARADEAAAGLAGLLDSPAAHSRSTTEVVAHARAAREQVIGGLLAAPQAGVDAQSS